MPASGWALFSVFLLHDAADNGNSMGRLWRAVRVAADVCRNWVDRSSAPVQTSGQKIRNGKVRNDKIGNDKARGGEVVAAPDDGFAALLVLSLTVLSFAAPADCAAGGAAGSGAGHNVQFFVNFGKVGGAIGKACRPLIEFPALAPQENQARARPAENRLRARHGDSASPYPRALPDRRARRYLESGQRRRHAPLSERSRLADQGSS